MCETVNRHSGKAYDVYVGRPGIFGNPVIIGKPCPRCGEKHDRNGTLSCYKALLWDKLKSDSRFREAVRALAGKKLACSCAPLACHADILGKAAEWLANLSRPAYAGIGARKTPQAILERMTKVARYLDKKGFSLRSGGAVGADTAFQEGSLHKEVFLAQDATDDSRETVREYHPAPELLGTYVTDLMARSAMQVLGKDLKTPVDFVICWTPDGCESHSDRTRSTGGTGQAISIASKNGIPIVNMQKIGWEKRLLSIMTGGR